jgi:hypothetical protein
VGSEIKIEEGHAGVHKLFFCGVKWETAYSISTVCMKSHQLHFPATATFTTGGKYASIASSTVRAIFITGGLLMEKNLRRKNQQIFRVDDDELSLIHEKIKMANIRSKERYYRKMVLDGYVIRTDFSDVREMIRLLSNSSN